MLNNGDERNSDDKRKNDGERNNDDSVRTSFTDAELDNALAGFEREFKEESQENLNSENLENNQKATIIKKMIFLIKLCAILKKLILKKICKVCLEIKQKLR